MRGWLDALLVVLLAPVCAACSKPLLRPLRGCICEDCWDAIVPIGQPRCERCGDHLPAPNGHALTASCAHCLHAESFLDRSRAVGLHTGTLRAIVHALKYDGRRSVARRLAALMRAAGPELVRQCDVVVPVPLHHARRRTRGFNQADDLARHLGPRVVCALRRVRVTETQTALPASERQANVAGAFGPTRHASALRGASVLLVDDVRTTGATLEACARVLKAEGVREVFALTAARVETPGS
jgi:ComF family protein